MTTKLTLNSKGSLRVEGDDIELIDSQGNKIDLEGKTKFSICRCGASNKMPFCDGSHKSCDFQDLGLDTRKNS